MAANRADASAAPEADVITEWVVPLVVEAVGVLALCYIGIGAIMATGGNDLLAIAVAHGLAIGLLAATSPAASTTQRSRWDCSSVASCAGTRRSATSLSSSWAG